MTKKKQSKRSAKQGGKKSSSRAGVAPTLHEIPAIKPGQPLAEAPVDPKTLSAPEAGTPKEPVTSLSTETPVTETPATETQVTETPATETPATETPATKTQVTETPETETPTHVDPQIDAHALSAPEPIHPEPAPADIAAEPTSHTSIAAAVTDQVIEPQPKAKDESISQAPMNSPTAAVDSPTAAVESPTAAVDSPIAPSPSPSPSITNDIPMPATLTSSAATQDSTGVLAAQAQDSTGAPVAQVQDSASSITVAASQPVISTSGQELPGQVQKTKYDIEAVKNAAPGVTPTASTAPALNPQSLGSLTRSKSRSEVARGLSSGKEEGYKWRPPVDYFGASASAFSSSFSGSSNRDLNALKKPSDASNNTPAAATPPQPTAPQPAMPPNPSPFANAPGTGPTTIKPLPFSAPNAFGNAPLPAPAPLPLPTPPVPPVPAVPPVSPAFPSAAATPAVPPAPAVPPQPLPNQPGPATPLKVYESTTDATALSPKMAKFIESLREREITASGTTPTMPQAATSVDLNAVPQQQAATSVDMNAAPKAPVQPAKLETAPSVLKPSSEAKPSPTPATADQTSRDLAPLTKESDAEAQPSKSTGDGTPLAPKSSSQVAELRESIISQKADGQSDDWHPIGEKKSPRKVDPQFSAELDDFKKSETIRHKSDSERHLTLEEMAAMDPDLVLAPQTPQQQSIRRLKNAGGIHAEIYIPIYLICLGLSWVTEPSAVSGTFRDAGQRVESSLQLISPKTLAENFRVGVDAFDDRDIKLHPFNPNKPRSIVSLLISRIQAFCSGLSSAFSRIPGTIASSTANNPLAQVMVLLSYLSVFSLALMIYLRFKRSTSWIIADFILLPIGLVAASTVITAVLISVLSMSVSLGAGLVSNTIVLYTTLAVILCVSDMARRTFLGRKKQ